MAVVGGVRIPFCRSNTFYADLSNLDMMTGALNALVDRYNLKGQHIDEVVGGAVGGLGVVQIHASDQVAGRYDQLVRLDLESLQGVDRHVHPPGAGILAQACKLSRDQLTDILSDEDSGHFWSPMPLPVRGATPYVTRHGFGYSVFEHMEDGIRSELTIFVALDAAVKTFAAEFASRKAAVA